MWPAARPLHARTNQTPPIIRDDDVFSKPRRRVRWLLRTTTDGATSCSTRITRCFVLSSEEQVYSIEETVVRLFLLFENRGSIIPLVYLFGMCQNVRGKNSTVVPFIFVLQFSWNIADSVIIVHVTKYHAVHLYR